MRDEREIYRLVAHDLDGVQIVLDVQSLEKLKSSLIYNFRFCLELFLNV